METSCSSASTDRVPCGTSHTVGNDVVLDALTKKAGRQRSYTYESDQSGRPPRGSPAVPPAMRHTADAEKRWRASTSAPEVCTPVFRKPSSVLKSGSQ